MANKRKIDDAGYRRLLAIALARRRFRQMPTDAKLAAEYRCSVRGVRDAMRRQLLSVTTVSGEIDYGNIPSQSLPAVGSSLLPCPASRNRSKNKTS